jgi:UDP-N-acetylglucosamine--N-acetylmuramyl-(pentapeptide) pyrophosphoryl-undecaprenol N-acetylglucosamine transferase
MSKLKVIISGGGTGGHIFPAIAIANALKTLRKDIEILFVGANGKMEMEKVPAAGFEIIGLNITGINRSLTFSNLVFPFKLIGSLLKSFSILRSFKPQVVIGVGGFASGPVLYAAQRKGIPTVIQEQNSYAGITNKKLGERAKRICVAYDGMDKFFPKDAIRLTGNPVRQDILKMEGKKPRSIEHFGLTEGMRTILVIGGSLGARTLNHSISAALEELNNSGLQIIWQTGKAFHAEALEKSKAMNNVKVYDFIQRMDLAYCVADLVISRAGASSISELCIVGRPSILVPFPFAAEDHQTKNAQALTTHNAAIMIPDNQAQEKLVREALQLINDSDRLEKLEVNVKKLAFNNADKAIANEILSLIS